MNVMDLKRGDLVSTRDSYGQTLAELGADHDFVVLDADLSGSTRTRRFAEAFPDRFFNAGIAEANMMGIAAGLAAAGKTVFASSFAMFAAGRAFEQVRNSVAYPRLNVKIAATHAGLTVGEDGATHQCLEDLALMRVLPGMTVICPSDAVETRLAVRAALLTDGPFYLRLGRLPVPVIHDPAGCRFEVGKGETLRDGRDVTLVATGLMTAAALKAADALSAEGIGARVLNFPTIKPLDAELLAKAASETGAVVAAEEHSVIGGLGSAVAECLSGVCPVPVLRLGVEDCFGCSGKAPLLLAAYGLTPDAIAAKARAAMRLRDGKAAGI